MAKARKAHAAPATEWDRIEEALAEGTVRGAKSAAAAKVLDKFDEAELPVLQRLATRARLSRSRGAPLGNVVFLHGITGADLGTIAGGKVDHIWTNFARLIVGQISRLKLRPDALGEANSKYEVVATGPNQRYYARAILALRANWNAVPFAYDWRRDIDAASDQLAAFIRAQFSDQPVHLVAHSMGGLVARNMIRRDPQLWDAMLDPAGVSGGRLVMLGTPNYGSFAIVQAMTGEDHMMSLLEKCDLPHNLSQLLEITNTFLGSYQLLPAPSKLPAALKSLYQADTWSPSAHISQAHLNNAYALHEKLAASATIDPLRMTYVAGCAQPTIVGMTIVGQGDFDYELSRDGDGRVPHALGLLRGISTYYIDEVHGDLARNEKVLNSLDELLETGATKLLSTSVVRGVERGPVGMLDYRSPTDQVLMKEIDRVARIAEGQARAQRNTAPEDVKLDIAPEDLKIGEIALVRAALGSGRDDAPLALPEDREVPETTRKFNLNVSLKFGDVREVKAPIVVVGHYRGERPTNAIGAIDAKLGGLIGLAVKRGIIAGNVGETFYVPTRGLIGAAGVVVAGMGDSGAFAEDDLNVLMMNVAVGAAALGHRRIATLLVGSGEGNLDQDTALRAILNGLGAGLSNFLDETGREPSLTSVTIVENNGERFLSLMNTLGTMKSDAFVKLKVRFTRPPPNEITKARRRPAPLERGKARRSAQEESKGAVEGDDVRLTIECADVKKGILRVSAITQSAVIPVREVTINLQTFRGVADELQKASIRADQEGYGRMLFYYALPEDFDDLIARTTSVRVIVDRATASFPWEMACFRTRSDRKLRSLGVELALTRQFRTMLTRPPGVSPPLNDKLRVLVIADPARESELQLPFARTEGRQVAETLRRLSRQELRIEVESRIGPNECNMVEILRQILTGDFDIVHFAGHGDYDPADPSNAGWIFGRDQVLRATDIFRARRVPRLVFANACFSGVIQQGTAQASDEMSRGLATIAQAFFERGVPNYLGTGWPVNDTQASTFAAEFYRQVLLEATLSKAMQEARRKIFDESLGSTWGAYQLYGNPRDVLVRLKPPDPSPGG